MNDKYIKVILQSSNVTCYNCKDAIFNGYISDGYLYNSLDIFLL